jgi:hypothetical protein
LKIRYTGSCWSLPEAAGGGLDRHKNEWFKSQMNLVFSVLLLFVTSSASAQTDHYISCSQDPQKLEARSKELAQIVKAD